MEDIIKEKGVPEPRLYEVGYHILPSVAEEDIPGTTSDIKAAIESSGGAVVSDGMPVLTTLAYPVPHVVQNKRKFYTTAYFGWIKFEASPEQAVAIKGALEGNFNILRFLISKAVKDKLPSSEKMTFMSEKQEGEGDEAGPVDAPKPEEAGANNEELDKTIDELVIK